MTNSPTPEQVELSDPALSAHRLQELAQTHPEHWDTILSHPNVYPGLADWIRARQSEVAPVQAQETSGEQPVAGTEDQQTLAYDTASPVEEASPAVEAELDPEPESLPEAESAVDVPAETVAPETAAEPVETAAELPEDATSQEDVQEPAQTAWAQPDASQTYEAPETTQVYGQQVPQEQQMWGWPGGQQPAQPQPEQQQQYGYEQYGQQPQAQPTQSYYGVGQQYYAQPQHYVSSPKASSVDLSSASAWGLIIAGGAAFLGLFGFIFRPALGYDMFFSSHLASGGWVLLLLFIATVAMSLLQLFKPSAWMRFFFMAVSLGAGFAMIGRTIALFGFFTMRDMGFSVVWLFFFSLIMVAGALMHLAPKTETPQQQPATPQQAQPGQMPTTGYGQQHGNYPYGGGHPGGQETGGYTPQG